MPHVIERQRRAIQRKGPGPLLSSCAMAAVAALSLHPQPAQAQAFRGTVESGSVTRQVTGPTTETVLVNASRTIVNWKFNPDLTSNYVFLPQGNVATFVNNPQAGVFGDYLVINRILASDNSRPRVDFLGEVRSRIDIGDFQTVQGGRLWFYSPGGILVGPSAVFDVGSLLLTANDPVEQVEFGYGTGRYTFTAAEAAATVTNQGTIKTAGQDSYFAMIAPRVVQAGSAQVAGSAVYAAAEVAVVTISGSLFDMSFTRGSDADTPGGATLTHSGTTRLTGAGEYGQQVVLAAVPKNDAITMLVSGDIGYAPAASAQVQGTKIVLSAGHHVSGNAIAARADTPATADIRINGGTFNADVEGQATGSAIATAAAGQPLSFGGSLQLTAPVTAALIAEDGASAAVEGDLRLHADDLADGTAGEARLSAGTGASVSIGGNAVLTANAGFFSRSPVETGSDAQGGTASILAQGGTITIGGLAEVSATAQGQQGSTTGGNATGGTASIVANGGSVTVLGAFGTLVDSSATGGRGGVTSGSGTGGTSSVRASGGGQVTIPGRVDLVSFGSGGGSSFLACEVFPCPGATTQNGGSGTGGSASLIADGGAIDVGSANLDVNGFGGDGDVTGGAAAGGTVTVTASAGGSIDAASLEAVSTAVAGNGQTGGNGTAGTVTIRSLAGSSIVTSYVSALAYGNGGAGSVGGTGVGGTIVVQAEGGSLDVGELGIYLDAPGKGGFGNSQGGAGIGGSAIISASAGGSVASLGDVELFGTALGGNAGSEGTAGGATGGTAGLDASAGTITAAGSALLDASSQGGSAQGSNGAATGGTAFVRASNGATINIEGFINIYGFAVGGGDFFSSAPEGADATGGTALIEVVNGGSITLGDTYLDASGYAGSGAAPGDGTGGLAAIRGQGNVTILGDTEVYAEGYGGGFGSSIGGTGRGGQAIIEAGAGSTFTFDGDVDLFARGQGGDSEDGGNGFGGIARFSSLGGDIQVADDLHVDASGDGGQDFGYGTFAPGTGTGGSATVEAVAVGGSGGTISILGNSIVMADGGAGTIFADGGANGGGGVEGGEVICCLAIEEPDFDFRRPSGAGVGGTASVIVRGGALNTPDLYVSAKGIGGPGQDGSPGPGGAGFTGTGGTASVELTGTGSVIGRLTLDARGGGGRGGDGGSGGESGSEGGGPGGAGGNGTGGTATLLIQNGQPQIGELVVTAGGYGAPGGTGAGDASGVTQAGGAGGTGTGGEILVQAGLGGVLTLGTFTFDATGQGGTGGRGSSDFEFGGQGGIGGAGGAGIGGVVELGTMGGTIVVTNPGGLVLTAHGRGGHGGQGGAADNELASEGDGGDGGQGSGGTARINIAGGSLTSPSTYLDSSGFGGNGGALGEGNFPIGGGFVGDPGGGSGGVSRITVADGNGVSGSASLGSTTLVSDAVSGSGTVTREREGGFAGRLIIEDLGTVAGGLQMATLSATSTGIPSPDGPAFEFTSTEGPVLVAGGVTIDVAGLISFSAVGSGGLNAAGPVSAIAGESILLSHVAPAPGAATVSGSSLFMKAGIGVRGSAGSLLSATTDNAVLIAPRVDIGRISAARDVVVQSAPDRLLTASITLGSATAGRDILLSSTGDVAVTFARAGDDFEANAGGAFTGGTIVTTGLGEDGNSETETPADGSNILVDAAGDVRLDNGDAAGAVRLTSSGGNILSSGTLAAGTSMEASGLGIDVNDVDAGTFVSLAATGGDLDAGTIGAGGSIFTSSSGATAIAGATSGDSIFVSAGGGAGLGTLSAARDIHVDAASIALASATAGRDVLLGAAGNITVTFAQAGDDFDASAGGTFTGGTVITTGLGEDGDGETPADGSNILVDAAGDVRLDSGNAADAVRLTSSAGNILSSGALAAGMSVEAAAGRGIDVNDVTAGTFVSLAAAGGDLDAGTIGAGGSISTSSSGATAIAGATSGDSIFVTAGGTAGLGTLSAAKDIHVDAASIALASATAGRDVLLGATGNIAVTFAQAGDDFNADAGGTFTGGTVVTTGLGADGDGETPADGSNIVVAAGGDARLDSGNAADALRLTSSQGNILSSGLLRAGASAEAAAGLGIDVNRVDAGTFVRLTASGGDLDADSIAAAGSIFVSSSGSTAIARATSGESIFVSAGGAAALGALTAGTDIGLATAGDLSVTFAQAGDDFDASAGGRFTGGTLVTTGLGADGDGETPADGSNIRVDAVGDVRLDNGDAADAMRLNSSQGNILSAGLLSAGTSVQGTAGLGIDVGDVDAGTFVRLTASEGDLDAGTIGAGGSIFTSSSGATAIAGATSGESIFVSSGGAAGLGTLNAAKDIGIDAALIALARATAGRDILLGANGNIAVTFAQAGDDFKASAGGAFTGETVVTTGLGQDGDGETPADGSNILVDAAGNARLDSGNAAGAVRLTSSGGNVLGSGTLAAGTSVEASAALGMDVNDVRAGTFVTLTAWGGDLDAGTIGAGGPISTSSSGATAIAGAASGDSIFVSAGGAAGLGTLSAAKDIRVDAASLILAGATAGRDVLLGATGDITVTFAQAGDDFKASAGGTFTGGTVITTGLGADSDGETPADGSNIVVAAAGNARLDSGNAAGAVRLTSSQGNVLSSGTLAAGTSVEATARLGLEVNDVRAGTSVTLTASGGDLDAGTIGAGGPISTRSSGATAIAGATSGGSVRVSAGGAASLGALTAGSDIHMDAASARLASATAGGNLVLSVARDLRLDNGRAAGAVQLTSTQGNILSDGLLSAGTSLEASAALGIDVNNLNAGSFVSLTASGGALDAGTIGAGGSIFSRSSGATTISGAASGGSVVVSAGGAAGLGTVRAAGDIRVDAASIALASATAGRDVLLGSTGDISVTFAQAGDDFEATAGGSFTGGTIVTTGLGPDGGGQALAAGGARGTMPDTGLSALGTASDGSNILVAAGGDLSLASGDAAGLVRLSSGGNILSSGALKAGESVEASAARGLTVGRVDARTFVSLAASGGGLASGMITAGGPIVTRSSGATAIAGAASGDSITVGAGGAAGLGALTAATDIRVDAASIALASATGGRDVLLSASGNIAGDVVRASRNVSLAAQAGSVVISRDLAAGGTVNASGTGVALTALNDLSVTNATASAGDILINSGGNLTIGNADATRNVGASAARNLSLTGNINGAGITLQSADIAVGSGARVGSIARTGTLQILANGPSVTLGGKSGSGSTGYQLDNSEFAAFAASNISFNATAGGAALRVEELTIRGSGSNASNVGAELAIRSGGGIDLVGAVAMQDAYSANALRFTASGGFFVDAASGSIAVTNGGALAGSLAIEARSIVAASRDAATGASAMATIDARNRRLGQNDGPANDAGYIRAGAVTLSAADRIWVQNSGGSDRPNDRAGIAAGAGGITLRATGPAPVEIIINGRQENGAAPVVGRGLIQNVTIRGEHSPAFASGSTINGCLIAGTSCNPPETVLAVPELSPVAVVQDFLAAFEEEDEDDPQDSFSRPPLLRLPSLIELAGYPFAPVVDEPVIGAGNEELWTTPQTSLITIDGAAEPEIVDQPATGLGNEELNAPPEQPQPSP